MQGFFDDHNHPVLEVTVLGDDSQMDLPALIDTGFDGYLSLPVPVAMKLGLKLIDTTLIALADGSTKSELLFSGWVELGGEEKEAYIFLTQGDTPLIGTRLLSDFTLQINFPRQEVSLS